MWIGEKREMLKFFLRKADHYKDRPVYQVLLEKARDKGVAGATVVPGAMGWSVHYGVQGEIGGGKEDVPVLVEMVDEPAHFEAFLNDVDSSLYGETAVLQNVTVFRHGGQNNSWNPYGTVRPKERGEVMEPFPLLKIVVGEEDHYRRRPIHEFLVEEARAAGIPGATVLRGIMGYGKSSRIHRERPFRLSEDLPMIVEMAAELEILERFLSSTMPVIGKGLVILESSLKPIWDEFSGCPLGTVRAERSPQREYLPRGRGTGLRTPCGGNSAYRGGKHDAC